MSATEIKWLTEYVKPKDSRRTRTQESDYEPVRKRKLEATIEALSASAHLEDSIDGVRKPVK